MAKLRVDKIATPIVQDEFTGSVYFDGTGDYLRAPSSSDFNFGSDDFTIEFWVYYVGSHTNYYELVDFRPSVSGVYPTIYSDANGKIYYYTDGGNRITSSVVPTNTWIHVAVTRSGTSTKLFIDGVQSGSTYSDSNTYLQSFVDIGASGNQSNYHLNGYLSNVRICKGHAVYTGNFTVPTRELEVHTKPPKGVVFPTADNRTVLLACQSSTDATLIRRADIHLLLMAIQQQQMQTQDYFVRQIYSQNTPRTQGQYFLMALMTF